MNEQISREDFQNAPKEVQEALLFFYPQFYPCTKDVDPSFKEIFKKTLQYQYLFEGKPIEVSYGEKEREELREILEMIHDDNPDHTEIVRKHPKAISYVPKKHLTESLCKEALMRNGMLLDEVPVKMRTEENCVTAMTSCLNAWKNASVLMVYVPDEHKAAVLECVRGWIKGQKQK